jgi:hypothetical protein
VQLPQAIVDQATIGVGHVSFTTSGPVSAQQRPRGGLGRVEPQLGLAVVLEAGHLGPDSQFWSARSLTTTSFVIRSSSSANSGYWSLAIGR